MKFKYYDPKPLALLLKGAALDYFSYAVCYGCVFSGVSPLDCVHHKDDFRSPPQQSDLLCPSCADTVEESKKPMHFHEDKNLTERAAELEEILRIASGNGEI